MPVSLSSSVFLAPGASQLRRCAAELCPREVSQGTSPQGALCRECMKWPSSHSVQLSRDERIKGKKDPLLAFYHSVSHCILCYYLFKRLVCDTSAISPDLESDGCVSQRPCLSLSKCAVVSGRRELPPEHPHSPPTPARESQAERSCFQTATAK